MRAFFALVVIWAVMLTVAEVAGRKVPTPENLAKLIERRPMEGLDAAGREAVVREVAGMFNGLNRDQKEVFREGDEEVGFEGQSWWLEALEDGEKELFVDLTMNQFFKIMLERFNAMDPEGRKRVVERTLRDLQREGLIPDGQEWMAQVDPALFGGMVSQGLETFYDGADADMKLRLAPLLEKMEERMRVR